MSLLFVMVSIIPPSLGGVTVPFVLFCVVVSNITVEVVLDFDEVSDSAHGNKGKIVRKTTMEKRKTASDAMLTA